MVTVVSCFRENEQTRDQKPQQRKKYKSASAIKERLSIKIAASVKLFD